MAVWTSMMEHHPSHWVHRSLIAVMRNCSPLMWGPAHALMWRVVESGWRILGACCAGRRQVLKIYCLCQYLLIPLYLCIHAVNCTVPAVPSNTTIVPSVDGTVVGYERLNETVLEGTVLTYQCDSVLSLTGPNNITCTNAGVWSTEPDTIMCVPPTEGEGGRLHCIDSPMYVHLSICLSV